MRITNAYQLKLFLFSCFTAGGLGFFVFLIFIYRLFFLKQVDVDLVNSCLWMMSVSFVLFQLLLSTRYLSLFLLNKRFTQTIQESSEEDRKELTELIKLGSINKKVLRDGYGRYGENYGMILPKYLLDRREITGATQSTPIRVKGGSYYPVRIVFQNGKQLQIKFLNSQQAEIFWRWCHS